MKDQYKYYCTIYNQDDEVISELLIHWTAAFAVATTSAAVIQAIAPDGFRTRSRCPTT